MRRLVLSLAFLSVLSAFVALPLLSVGTAYAQAPATLPATGTGMQADTSLTAGWLMAGALLVLVAGAAGLVAYRRPR